MRTIQAKQDRESVSQRVQYAYGVHCACVNLVEKLMSTCTGGEMSNDECWKSAHTHGASLLDASTSDLLQLGIYLCSLRMICRSP